MFAPVGCGVVRIGPAVSWPKVVKSVPNHGLVFCFVSYGRFFLFVFCVLFLCFWLSVTVQMIAWKDSSKVIFCVHWDVKPYTLTHSP